MPTPTVVTVREATLLKASASLSDKDSTEQKHFFVQLSSKPADPLDVLTIAAAVIPAIGEAYSGGSSLKCNKLTPSSMGSVTDYLIVADFSIPNVDATYEPNPVDRPDQLEFATSSKESAYFLDHSATPARSTNKWGEPIDPLPTRTGGEFSIRIKGNRASIDATLYATYYYPEHAINNAAFTVRGLPIGTGEAKILSFRATPTVEKTYSFLACEWEVALSPTWDQTFEHRGFVEPTEDSKLKRIVRGKPAEPVEKPWPLGDDGLPKDNAYDEPATLTRKPYPAKDFSIFDWTP